MLRLLSTEILFKQIYFVILSDALLGSSNEIFCGLGISKIGVSVEFLKIFCNVTWLCVIIVLGPSYFEK
jgi:hypothetical protein